MNDRHWIFLCFTRERFERLQAMIAEMATEMDRTLTAAQAKIGPGVLWNARPCELVAILKTRLDYPTLSRAMHKEFGYESVDPDCNVFTLGVTKEEDAAVERMGLFGDERQP
jgi:hypothetical protein